MWAPGVSLEGSRLGGCPAGKYRGDFALSYQDRTITCSDCGKPFVFTAGEQAFFAEKGFAGGPKRCPQCRALRRAERDGGTAGGPGGPRPGGFSGPRPGGPGGPGGPAGAGGPGSTSGPGGAPGSGPRPYTPRPGGPSGPRPGGFGGPRPGGASTLAPGLVPFMRGRGGPRPVLPVEEPYRINERIFAPELRLIVEDEDGEEKNIGVVPLAEAQRMAQERELDLVEIAPQAQPPVCKIMDYGRFKYSMERKQREAHRAGKAGRAASEMKDVQLSPRIDEHDMMFKVDRAQEFLSQGHPVRMVVRFLGRDMRHPEVGMATLQEALKVLGEKVNITVDQQPRMEGRQLFALVRLTKSARAEKKPAERRVEADADGDIAAPVAAISPEAASPDGVATVETAAPADAGASANAPAAAEAVAAGS